MMGQWQGTQSRDRLAEKETQVTKLWLRFFINATIDP